MIYRLCAARFRPPVPARLSRRPRLHALLALAGLLASGSALFAQVQPVALDPDVERQARVAQLVARMTLEEKVSQMQNHSVAIPRLGIPEYDWWSEGLHGTARSGYATLFPQAVGLAATWDTDLLHQVAATISVEARAKYNQAIRENNHSIYYGLTIWSPNINIFRDPRWGRGQETYGEDPYLTSRLGVAFVSGLQGDDRTYLRAVATPKHFAVHSGPESERHKFDVTPSPHDFADTYLPAFRATVTEAHAQSIMCAYNALDGEPACANRHLLADVLRRDWNFGGFVTSDCGAVTDVAEGHKFSPDVEHAAVASLRAGTDTSCGDEYGTLTKAVHDGLIEERELDTAVQRLFLARFRLGMFDPPAKVMYAGVPVTELDSPEHHKLALQAAREAMVLLKNENGTLPLASSVKTIAVIGPNAQSLAALEGNYNAIPSMPVTPLDGLRKTLGGRAKLMYAQGAPYVDSLPLPAPETLFHPAAGDGEPGLRAEYFATADLSGKPVATRVDRHIDFDWNAASPAPGLSLKEFSVRWSGTIEAPAAGEYTFGVTFPDCYPCNDAETYTVRVDGRVVAERTVAPKNSRPRQNPDFHIALADTQPHAFTFEYTHKAPLFGGGLTLNWQPPVVTLREQAVRAAQQADVVVAFVGLSPDLEGEEMPIKVKGFLGGDRTDIELPPAQQQMLEAVAATGKPLVVVLMNGSALAVNWAEAHAGAILEAWYPGEEGGTALAETLLGKNNPGGRLPVTFYASIDQLPAFNDYSMSNRTYRYSHAKPLYEFGAGLSYTTFRYSAVKLGYARIAAGSPATLSVTVTNSGSVAGDEVVQVYLQPPASPLAPQRALVAFARVHLSPGESRPVSLRIDPRQLGQVDAAGKRSIAAGHYRLFVGGRQPAAGDEGLQLEVTGRQPLPD